jgi:hypothetical protein
MQAAVPFSAQEQQQRTACCVILTATLYYWCAAGTAMKTSLLLTALHAYLLCRSVLSAARQRTFYCVFSRCTSGWFRTHAVCWSWVWLVLLAVITALLQ